MSSRFIVGDTVDTPVFGGGKVVYIYDGEMCLKSEEEGLWTENVDDTSLTLVYSSETEENTYTPTKEEAERVAKMNEEPYYLKGDEVVVKTVDESILVTIDSYDRDTQLYKANDLATGGEYTFSQNSVLDHLKSGITKDANNMNEAESTTNTINRPNRYSSREVEVWMLLT